MGEQTGEAFLASLNLNEEKYTMLLSSNMEAPTLLMNEHLQKTHYMFFLLIFATPGLK